MNSNNWLALLIISVIGLAAYMALTQPKPHDGDPYANLEEDWWG